MKQGPELIRDRFKKTKSHLITPDHIAGLNTIFETVPIESSLLEQRLTNWDKPEPDLKHDLESVVIKFTSEQDLNKAINSLSEKLSYEFVRDHLLYHSGETRSPQTVDGKNYNFFIELNPKALENVSKILAQSITTPTVPTKLEKAVENFWEKTPQRSEPPSIILNSNGDLILSFPATVYGIDVEASNFRKLLKENGFNIPFEGSRNTDTVTLRGADTIRFAQTICKMSEQEIRSMYKNAYADYDRNIAQKAEYYDATPKVAPKIKEPKAVPITPFKQLSQENFQYDKSKNLESNITVAINKLFQQSGKEVADLKLSINLLPKGDLMIGFENKEGIDTVEDFLHGLGLSTGQMHHTALLDKDAVSKLMKLCNIPLEALKPAVPVPESKPRVEPKFKVSKYLKNPLIKYMKKRSVPKEAKDLIKSKEFTEWKLKREHLEAYDIAKVGIKKQLQDKETQLKDAITQDEKKIEVLKKDIAVLNNDIAVLDAKIGPLEKELESLENSLLKKMKNVTLKTFTVKDTRDAVGKPKEFSEQKPQFTLLTGLDARELPSLSIGKSSTIQLASQFDLQESPSAAQKNPVYKYHRDKTQGPLACLASDEAMLAALLRKSANNNKKLPDILKGVPKQFKEIYQNGYLSLDKPISRPPPKKASPFTDEELKPLREYLEKHKDELNILPQFLGKNGLMQVCCAAPTFLGPPKDGSERAQIAKILVIAQYEAMARIAVLKSRATGKQEDLNLSLVGQGAFNNPEGVMKEAFAAVAKIVAGKNVQVYVHAFDDKAIKNAKTQLDNAGVEYITKTAEELKKQLKENETKQLSLEDKNAIVNWANEIDINQKYAPRKQFSKSFLPSLEQFVERRENPIKSLQETINKFKTVKTHGQRDKLIETLERQIDEQSKILKKEQRIGKSDFEKKLEDLKESLRDLKVTLNIELPKEASKKSLRF